AFNPVPAMNVVKESGAVLVLDADRAAGPVGMDYGSSLAMQKAAEHGVGFVLIRRTTHTGALGFMSRRLPPRDMRVWPAPRRSPTCLPRARGLPRWRRARSASACRAVDLHRWCSTWRPARCRSAGWRC